MKEIKKVVIGTLLCGSVSMGCANNRFSQREMLSLPANSMAVNTMTPPLQLLPPIPNFYNTTTMPINLVEGVRRPRKITKNDLNNIQKFYKEQRQAGRDCLDLLKEFRVKKEHAKIIDEIIQSKNYSKQMFPEKGKLSTMLSPKKMQELIKSKKLDNNSVDLVYKLWKEVRTNGCVSDVLEDILSADDLLLIDGELTDESKTKLTEILSWYIDAYPLTCQINIGRWIRDILDQDDPKGDNRNSVNSNLLKKIIKKCNIKNDDICTLPEYKEVRNDLVDKDIISDCQDTISEPTESSSGVKIHNDSLISKFVTLCGLGFLMNR